MTNQHASFSLTIEHLWQFSLQYYAVRNVKEACLSLQNNFGGNVNLLLLLKYLDEHQVTIGERDWKQLLSSIEPTDKLISSYRELRRSLKAHLPDTLYREALRFELQLEKQQQADLVRCISQANVITAGDVPLTQRYCQSLNAMHLHEAFNHNAPNKINKTK